MAETAAITGAAELGGAVRWRGRATVAKYWADDDLRRATPYEVLEGDNLLLTAGATLLLNRLCGIAGTALDETNARVCVGDGTAAAAAGQTDLQGTNKFRKLVDAAPTVSGNQAFFWATFDTSEANFDWEEAGLANAAAGATLVNRFVQSFGTKTSSLQWTLTITVTAS
ncbi:hypothetical protein [Pseudonocardia asaccharolytica]|uniref:hypothetical protein n=1 Tax=Pseudonocardia asaccharolytica TaxID=54010 RepID=UPI0011BD5162|nr:hypothetical protein [Pseudonocardia asaccharolytica]